MPLPPSSSRKGATGLSKGTEDVLNGLFKDAKLSKRQIQELTKAITNQGQLPHQSTVERKVVSVGPQKVTFRAQQNRSDSFSGIRTKAQILASNPYERDRYFPTAPKLNVGPSEKERYQVRNELLCDPNLHKKAATRAAQKENEQQLFDRIVGEIDERKEFMDEMGPAYNAQMKGEIAERIRDLNLLDKHIAGRK